LAASGDWANVTQVRTREGNKELAAAAFNARVLPSVAYTDPEVAWVGLTEDQAKVQGIKVKKGLFPWTASGRAIANGRDEGITKLLFDDSPDAHGHGKTIHPHPALCESAGMAAEIAHGSCTALLLLDLCRVARSSHNIALVE